MIGGRKRSSEQGTILIVSLWILAILTVLSVGLGHRMGLELKVTGYQRDRLRALHFAKAGIRRAILELERDMTSLRTSKCDTLYECGVKELESSDDLEKIFKGKLGEGEFVVGYVGSSGRPVLGMMDEERRININKASQELLEALLEVSGIIEEKEALARSIRTWRGDTEGIDQASLIDEDRYYEELEPSYPRKGTPFEAIEELLLVRGMDEAKLSKIRAAITIFGDGKLNINTSDEKVLMALALASMRKMAGLKDPMWVDHLIKDLIDGRDGFDDKPGTDDDESFTDISHAKAWVKETKAKAILDYMKKNGLITFRSNNFRISAVGKVNKVARRATAIIQRHSSTGKVEELKFWRQD